MFTLHTRFSPRFGTDLHAQSVLIDKNFLRRSSGGSLLRVRCWLGCREQIWASVRRKKKEFCLSPDEEAGQIRYLDHKIMAPFFFFFLPPDSSGYIRSKRQEHVFTHTHKTQSKSSVTHEDAHSFTRGRVASLANVWPLRWKETISHICPKKKCC